MTRANDDAVPYWADDRGGRRRLRVLRRALRPRRGHDAAGAEQSYFEDCPVCCRPMEIFVRSRPGRGPLDQRERGLGRHAAGSGPPRRHGAGIEAVLRRPTARAGRRRPHCPTTEGRPGTWHPSGPPGARPPCLTRCFPGRRRVDTVGLGEAGHWRIRAVTRRAHGPRRARPGRAPRARARGGPGARARAARRDRARRRSSPRSGGRSPPTAGSAVAASRCGSSAERRRCGCPGAWRRRTGGRRVGDALAARGARSSLPLLLRPAITLLALVSRSRRARPIPYGFTLPVALTQDWGVGQDLAALAALVALRLPRPAPARAAARRGVPPEPSSRTRLLAPDWAWRWEGHPGNEPKYLRQAVALGQFLTFDAEGVSAGDGGPPGPAARGVAARGRARRSAASPWAMAVALARGEVGRDAIRADPHHAPDGPGQGRRRLLRAGARAVADAGAGAAPRPGHQPLARRAGPGRGERPPLVRARRAPGRGALPAGAGRDGPAGPRVGARARLRPRAALPLLLVPVLPGDGRARSSSPSPSGRSPCGRESLAPAPVAPRLAARDAAVAPPEVPAGRGWCSWRRRSGWRSEDCRRPDPRNRRPIGGSSGPGRRAPRDDDRRRRPPRSHPRQPLPDRALQLRDHRQRAAGRALPGLGAGRGHERARGPGRPRPAPRRAVRDPALRARPDARRRRPRARRAQGASPSCCRRPSSTT